MKLNRRSFFGAAATAPLAAKQAATSVLEYEKTQGVAPYSVIGSASASSYAEAEPVDWLKSALKEALAQKKETASAPLDGHSRTKDLVAYIQIDNRRATSPAVRAMLISEERARRERARELSYLDARIKKLKDRLGPLASLFDGDA